MDKEIDKITKNPETDIVIRIDDYMGKKGLTIREFIKTERYTGFTKAGTRVPADKFEQFKKAINSIDPKDLEGSDTQPANPSYQQSNPQHKQAQSKIPQKSSKQESQEEVEF